MMVKSFSPLCNVGCVPRSEKLDTNINLMLANLDEHIPESQRVKPIITKKEQITAELIAYWRQRPDECSEQLLGIRLNNYQKILIRDSWNKRFVMWLLSRGLGKSWLGMLYLVLKAILYPNLLIGIVSPTYQQAKRVLLDKFEREILRDSPFLLYEFEYSNFKKSQADTSVTFYNMSRIKAVSAGQSDDSSQRGDRFHILLCDEYAQIRKEVIDRVINPSMNNKVGYKVGQKNNSNTIQNQIIIASTAFYRFNHLWNEFVIYLDNMLKGNKDYVVYTFPYQVGIDVGLFDEVFIEKERQRMSPEDFEMEYCNFFPSIGENSWIQFDDLMNCADLDCFYFKGDDKYETIISVDVAVADGGDNSCFKVGKIIPRSNGDMEVDEVRTITANGMSYEKQHDILRQLLKDYPNTKRIFMDINGVGQGLYQECTKPYWDHEDQKELPPLIAINDEEAVRNIPNGVPLIYSIYPSIEFNHKMGVLLKTYTQKNWLHMYHDGTRENKESSLTLEQKAQILEAEATRREVLKIEATPSGTYFKFGLSSQLAKSKAGRKDRWSALCMLIYGANMIKEEKQEENRGNFCTGVAMRF